MKYILFLIITVLCFNANAQFPQVDSFTASNGVTYRTGDLVELGKGSAHDGSFIHLRISGWGAAMGANDTKVGAHYGGQKVKIKRINIEKNKRRGYEKVWVLVGAGNITNYSIDLESAIKSCEVIPCDNVQQVEVVNGNSMADELAKLKKLKDEGVLTEEEFAQQKSKLLNK